MYTSYNSEIFKSVHKYTTLNGKTTYSGIQIATKLNQKNGQFYPLIDAIDIDWNGAKIPSFPNFLIYTTEDLIYVLDELNKANDSSLLHQEIQNIWNQINEITASYVTHTYLSNFIDEHLQKTLTAGEFISISEDNVISAYGLPTYTYLADEYTSKFLYDSLNEFVTTQIYTKVESDERASYWASTYVAAVVDGAPQAFDTLKEIADWILKQNRYTPVDREEVYENWKEDTYYYLDEETGEYKPVPDAEFAREHDEYTYYKVENWFTDITDLLERMGKIEGTVGGFYEDNGIITYTGLFKDIHDLEFKYTELSEFTDQLGSRVEDAEKKALDAVSKSEEAYLKAEDALSTANDALEEVAYSVEKSSEAYDMAYKASQDVGVPSIPNGYVEITDIESEDDFNKNKELFGDLWIKEGNSFKKASSYDPDQTYFYYQEYVEGTGLTKRVEDVENTMHEYDERLTLNEKRATEALYGLHTDNTKSSYITLNILDEKYEDNYNSDRTIHITTQEASIDPISGEVYSDGMMTLKSCTDSFAYLSSWLLLGLTDDDDKTI